MIKLENQDFTSNYVVPERKVNYSLPWRGGSGWGVIISVTYLSIPPAPPTRRAVLVQALLKGI